MARQNSPVEMSFQAEIQAVFERYHHRIGFAPMADNLLGWLIANFRHHTPSFTKEQFQQLTGTTWDVIVPLMEVCPVCKAGVGQPCVGISVIEVVHQGRLKVFS